MIRDNLTRLLRTLTVLRVKRTKPLVHQIAGKSFCARCGRRQQQNAEPFLFINLQILHKLRKAVIIGRNIARIHRKTICEPQSKILKLHRGKRQNTHSLKPRHNLRHAKKHVLLLRKNISAHRPARHAFTKLQLHRPRMLLHPQRLVNVNAALPVCKKVRKRHRIFIKISKKALQIDIALKLRHLLLQILNIQLQPVRLLRLRILAKIRRPLLAVPLNLMKPLIKTFLGENQLRRRIN